MLLLSALIIEKVVPIFHWNRVEDSEDINVDADTTDMDKTEQINQLTMGVIPVLIASGISGLGKCSIDHPGLSYFNASVWYLNLVYFLY